VRLTPHGLVRRQCAGRCRRDGLILFAIGDFSLPITMAQLANLADRYVAANAIRRDQFDQEVIIGFFAILLAVAFFRRSGFARAFEDKDTSNA
jgi:hypothetical protein